MSVNKVVANDMSEVSAGVDQRTTQNQITVQHRKLHIIEDEKTS